MNIYQLSLKSEIPLKALRRLEKLGVLKVDAGNEELEKLIFHMRGNQILSVAQLLRLIEQPDLLAEMRAWKPRYAKRAREQIAALGDMSSSLAPRDVTAAVVGAARGEDDESLVIAEWLKTVLPAVPVGHAWVAVRLLLPLNEFMRGNVAPSVNIALMNMRKLPELRGWWRSDKIGTRSVIQYWRPASLDRLDL